MRKAIAFAAVAAMLGMAASAQAGPYFIKIEGVDGESTARDHKGWIELQSLRLVEVSAGGGVTVASGDVKGDGAPAPRAAATGKGSAKVSPGGHEAAHVVQQGPARLNVAGPDPVPAGLLLPAVQKVRSAHLKRSAWPGCRAGAQLGPVAIRDEANGKTGRILDASVEQCASEQVSLNFTKIEW